MWSLTRLCLLAVIAGSCSSPAVSPSASPSAPSTTATLAPAAGLAAPIPATAPPLRHWWTLPDGLFNEPATVYAQFTADPAAGTPIARLRPGGREALLHPSTGPGNVAVSELFRADLDLAGLSPATYSVEIVEHLAGGGEAVVATTEIVVSAPEYVVWTLDFEGDGASDEALGDTAAILDGLAVRGTLMWNARVWTTTQVSAERADAMVAWTKARAAKGDEVALHVHAWTDFVRDAGVTPRTAPNWGGRSDGYDVPLTAFDESETRRLIDHAVDLMTQHGFAKPTSFRAGGLFANAANLRAIAAAGFTADSSAAPAGGFGRLPLPWTLPRGAQPYRPSRDDANVPGDLPLVEAPNIAGNTYALTVNTIQTTIRDDLAMLAAEGQPATARRALTLVSHPATIDPTERAAIEALFNALAPLRYDRDAGPVRFVTLSQLAKAYSD